MKYVKMLALAAVAAAAVMAVVGASSASATVLCAVEGVNSGGQPTGTTCPAGSGYGNEKEGIRIESSLVAGTKAKLTTEFATIECSKSSVAGKTMSEGSATETVKGPIETLTFTECNCEVAVLEKGTLEVHWISSSHNGTVTSNGAKVTTTCSTIFGNVHCIYVTENTDLGTLTGGNPAKLDANASIPRLVTNSLCSAKANWTAEYEVTAPKPLFVAGHT